MAVSTHYVPMLFTAVSWSLLSCHCLCWVPRKEFMWILQPGGVSISQQVAPRTRTFENLTSSLVLVSQKEQGISNNEGFEVES